MKIRTKFNVLLLGILVISSIVAVSIFTYIQTQNEFSRYINLAGRQRALTEKMARQTLIYKAGNKAIQKDLLNTQNLFEKTLLGFTKGDSELSILPVNNKVLQERLIEMEQMWSTYKEYLNKIMDERTFSLNDFDINTTNLFNIANDVTAEFENIAKQKARLPYNILVVGIFLIFIGTILGWLLMDRQALKPLAQLVKITSELARGNLAIEIFSYKSKNEIGALIAGISMMQNNYKLMIKQINQASLEVAGSSQQLVDSSERVDQYAQNVGSSTQEVAAGAQEQTSQISETAANVENLIEQINQINNMSKEMNQAGTIVLDNVIEGSNYVSQTITQMGTINDKVNQSRQIIINLGDKSSQVDEIVRLINSIAEQTNLLALNAAIESARAGEHGKGFAVVAEEVRKLAEQSRDATKQISILIKEIQSSISAAVNTIKDSSNEVTLGVESMDNTGNSFEIIKENSQKLLIHIDQVTDNTNKMNEYSHNVKLAIQEIATVSEEFAASTEEIASSGEEQARAVNEITIASKNLSLLSQKLNKSVSSFKLN